MGDRTSHEEFGLEIGQSAARSKSTEERARSFEAVGTGRPGPAACANANWLKPLHALFSIGKLLTEKLVLGRIILAMTNLTRSRLEAGRQAFSGAQRRQPGAAAQGLRSRGRVWFLGL